ncbi:MAG: ATP-binding protein [Polyangiales bacterium]|nr:HAMP domain-containing protein [Myxococcales bacterium]MCB9660325.1 HAMP domain-containing protein [Sandaracinaceae bacterium]
MPSTLPELRASVGVQNFGTLPPMEPRRKSLTHLGLRSQIVLALSVTFVLAFGLFAVALVRITQRGRADDRVSDVRAAATLFARALSAPSEQPRERFVALSAALLGEAGVRGVELEQLESEPWVRGVTGLGAPVDATLDDGRRLRLWVRAPAVDTSPHLSLVLGYVSVTGAFVLLLAYVALTALIVRPVERITQAVTRLAEGKLRHDVPVSGAAEVAELAVGFNRMAAQLRADRDALERRLQELLTTTRELEAAQAQVVRGERLASVGRLAAGVAHELGNPLSAVVGLLELVREGDLDAEESAEFLARAQRETERMHRIIRDLLDFARQGTAAVDPAAPSGDADVAAIVDETLRLLAPQKDMGRVRLERAFEEGLPHAAVDPEVVRQVALNLLLNAVDALAGDGLVRVTLAPDGEELLLQVSDSGPGIAPVVREHLFEPFVTTKAAGEGTGLGLAVVHGLVERAGGRIAADDATEEEGGGARFRVWFPTP